MKEELETLLCNNKTAEVFERLLQILPRNHELRSEVILLLLRFKEVEKRNEVH